jgi:hypothetical protein
MAVVVTGPIATSQSSDTYATHDANLGAGGVHTVATTTARNAITTFRRKEGMLAYVTADQSYWRLKPGTWDGSNNDWASVSFGTALSTTIFDFPTPVNQWVINHSFNTYPQVTLLDTSGHEIGADVTQVDMNTIHVDFSYLQDGKAVLRP